jgi:hypothetical protein
MNTSRHFATSYGYSANTTALGTPSTFLPLTCTNTIIGGNTISGNENTIIGYESVVRGDNNVAIGNKITLENENNKIVIKAGTNKIVVGGDNNEIKIVVKDKEYDFLEIFKHIEEIEERLIALEYAPGGTVAKDLERDFKELNKFISPQELQ